MPSLSPSAARGVVDRSAAGPSVLASTTWLVCTDVHGQGLMSGQIMGEVIAASEVLRARGLSQRGFHALLAIADRADTKTRVASVPLRHVCAVLYGDVEVKHRTAQRALQDLRAAGLIRVLRRGFDNGHGHAAAPIYEIQPLPVPVTGDVNGKGDNVTGGVNEGGDKVMGVVNEGGVYDTHDGNGGTVYVKRGDRLRQNDDRLRHSSDVLNVFTNGLTNGARADGTLPRCTGRDCTVCAIITKAINDCSDCDQYGRDVYDHAVDCPHHGNFRLHIKRKAS